MKDSKVFISYKHGDYEKLLKRLVEELKEEEYDIWFDLYNIPPSVKWDSDIGQAIMDSKHVIGVLSKEALADSSFCLNELLFAMQNNKSIIPIKFEEVTLPLFLLRIQYVDMISLIKRAVKDEKSYQEFKKKLKDGLRNINNLELKSDLHGLDSILKPVNNESLLRVNKTNFIGREWLFDEYDKFLTDTKDKFFVILGLPGTGKSTIVTKLTELRKSISAIHFCIFGDEERVLPNKVIKSLAFHLSSQLKSYQERLHYHINNIENLGLLNNKSLFDRLITAPLSEISKPSEDVVIVIDALDEAKNNGVNELVELLVSEFKKTPDWVRCVVTSRPESEIVNLLDSYKPIYLHEHQNSKQDYLFYIEHIINENNLKINLSDNDIEALISSANDSFIYIRELLLSSESGEIEFTKLPKQLNQLYSRNFKRLIKNSKVDYDQHIRPVLEVILASLGDLTDDDIIMITNLESYDYYNVINSLEMYFERVGDFIKPRHKTVVEWLTDSKENNEYYVDQASGHNKILANLEMRYENGLVDDYTVKYIIKHAILSSSKVQTNLLKAKDYLVDYELYKLREELVGKIAGLQSYLTDIILCQEKNKVLTNKVIESDVFKKIFNENRRIFLDAQLIALLPRIGFDRFVDKYYYSDNIWDRITILRYTRFNGDFDKQFKYTLETVEKFRNHPDPFELGKLYQFAALNTVFYGDYQTTVEYLEKALESVNGHSKGNWEYLSMNSFYSDTLTSLNKIEEAIERLTKNVADLEEIHKFKDTDTYYNKNLSIQIMDASRCLVRHYCFKGNFELATKYLNKILSLDIEDIRYYEDYNRFKIVQMFYHITFNNYNEVTKMYNQLLPILTTDHHISLIHFYYAIYLMKINVSKDVIQAEIDKGLEYGNKRNNRTTIEKLLVLEAINKGCKSVKEYNNEYLNRNSDYYDYFEYLYRSISNNLLKIEKAKEIRKGK